MRQDLFLKASCAGLTIIGLLLASVSAAPRIVQGSDVEAVPTGTPVRTFYNDASGTVSADLLTGTGTLVYRSDDVDPSSYSVFHNFQPEGAFIAEPMTLSAEYADSGGIVGYEAKVYLSGDNDTGFGPPTDFHIELWDGDPLAEFDTAGNGYLNAPIPGTQVTWTDLPGFTRMLVLKASLPAPVSVSNADNRVWMVMTSDACRLGWLYSFVLPSIGSNGGLDLWQVAGDQDGARNGLGTCYFLGLSLRRRRTGN